MKQVAHGHYLIRSIELNENPHYSVCTCEHCPIEKFYGLLTVLLTVQPAGGETHVGASYQSALGPAVLCLHLSDMGFCKVVQRSQNKVLTNLLISSSLVLQFDNCLLCQSFTPLHSVNELLTMKPICLQTSKTINSLIQSLYIPKVSMSENMPQSSFSQ